MYIQKRITYLARATGCICKTNTQSKQKTKSASRLRARPGTGVYYQSCMGFSHWFRSARHDRTELRPRAVHDAPVRVVDAPRDGVAVHGARHGVVVGRLHRVRTAQRMACRAGGGLWPCLSHAVHPIAGCVDQTGRESVCEDHRVDNRNIAFSQGGTSAPKYTFSVCLFEKS